MIIINYKYNNIAKYKQIELINIIIITTLLKLLLLKIFINFYIYFYFVMTFIKYYIIRFKYIIDF